MQHVPYIFFVHFILMHSHIHCVGFKPVPGAGLVAVWAGASYTPPAPPHSS